MQRHLNQVTDEGKTSMLNYTIHGNDMQLIELNIDASKGIRAEVGAMMYMGSSIKMETTYGGSLMGAAKRYLTGEAIHITSFRHNGPGSGSVAFGAPFPGKIVPLDLGKMGANFLCQKDSFLCCESETYIDIAFVKKLGFGLFGGEGFILQRLVGKGMAFVHAGGTVVHKSLERGESLVVDTGCLVGLQEGVQYDIQFVGGFRNAMFGGEGVFLARLTGPGDVYLQSLPFSRLVDRITMAQGEMGKASGR
jgi:uncharacterized protein (TIGR00266 family)